MIRAVFGGQVEFRDCRCQRRHELEIEGAGGRQPVEQRLLREAVHLHEPVHRRAVPAERIRSVVLAGDSDDSTIEGRCGPPVEANFRLTQRAAALGRRKVEIVEPDGPLQLVCARAREKDDGCVRVDALHRSRRRAWMARRGSR